MLYKLQIAKNNQKTYKAALNKLKARKPKHIDELFQSAHDQVFACTDCLQCANCCKTTGPLFTDKDITRIAKFLKIKPGEFVDHYLKIDEDNDYVLQETPCKFLGLDNYCSIYEVRPKACREYPHTDRNKQKQLFKLHLANSTICPAVVDILDEIL